MKYSDAKARRALAAAEMGEPIDWHLLRQHLLALDINEHRLDSGVRVRRLLGSLYRLEIVDLELRSRIDTLLQVNDLSSRTHAAKTQSSHGAKLMHSLMLVTYADDENIHVRVCSADRPVPLAQHRAALIIENQDCFMDIDNTWDFAHHNCGLEHDKHDLEFIHAQGNAISNEKNAAYLKQFDRLYCLLDIDFGGLSIYRNLRLMLPEHDVRFLIPDDLQVRLKSSKKTMNAETRAKLSRFNNLSPTVSTAVRLIEFFNGAYIEQESYRAG